MGKEQAIDFLLEFVSRRPKRLPMKWLFVKSVPLMIFVSCFAVWMIHDRIRNRNKPSSLIDHLRAGVIQEKDIQSVEVLKFDPGAGWPFTEEDYARKMRASIDAPQQIRLIELLRSSSTDGWQHRNHPKSVYHGILRFTTHGGIRYLVFYTLESVNGRNYAVLRSGGPDVLDPNHAKEFENDSLVPFLRSNDPWFRDVDSPPQWHRPSFPDDAP